MKRILEKKNSETAGRQAGWGWDAARKTGRAIQTILLVVVMAVLVLPGCSGKKKTPQPTGAEEGFRYFQQGSMLLENNRFQDAEDAFRSAIELDPEHPVYHYSLALSHISQQELDQALASLEKALDIKPDYSDCLNLMGIIYNQKGEYIKAMEQFRKVVATPEFPKPWTAYYNMGFAAASVEHFEEALYYYSKAVELDPNYIQARQQRALMLERLSRRSEAVEEYVILLESIPDNVEVHFSLARLYFQDKMLEKARLHFDRVMNLAPGTEYSAQAAKYLNQIDRSTR